MSKYTIEDVSNIVPTDLTPSQIKGVEKYLNEGVIPPADPCVACEPNFIRKLISLIQVAERSGYFPPKREAVTEPMVEDVEYTQRPEYYDVEEDTEED